MRTIRRRLKATLIGRALVPAEHALDDACLLTNPRSVDLDDARELFHAAL